MYERSPRQEKIMIPDAELGAYRGETGFSAREYLSVASGLVHAYDNEDAYCKEYTSATMGVYKKLLDLNGRRDLEDDVRIALTSLNKEGHIWLQVRDGNGWIDYEPIQYTPKLLLEDVPDYSEMSRDQKALTDADGLQGWASFPGTKIVYPLPDELQRIVLKGGLLGMVATVNAP